MMVTNARTWSRRFPLAGYLLIGVCLITLAGMIEYKMGRLPICKCGTVHFWVGDANGPETSQQVADWYSFSHIIHGFALYGLMRLIGRGRWPLGLCLVLAIGLECTWEVVENSSFVINRYRQTASADYYGDSILNSMSDICFAVIGFVLAAYLPVWLTILLIVVMEVGVACAIRDNLTLNIIMLIHPFKAIRHWQMGS
jgi:hypothetical protein